MPNLCVTCEHPQLRSIDELLQNGRRSWRSISAEFGINQKALGRHAKNHLPASRGPRAPQSDRAASAPPGRGIAQPGAPDAAEGILGEGEPVDIRAELTRQLAFLNGLDASNLSPTAQVNLADAKRRAAEALAKVQPPSPAAPVKVREVEGLEDIFYVMHMVLDRPANSAVRNEIAAALKEHRATLAGTSLEEAAS